MIIKRRGQQVYEHLVFSGHQHTTLRSLPGMQDWCVRIGSAGKTFSFTAWKVGRICCSTGTLQNPTATCHNPIVIGPPY